VVVKHYLEKIILDLLGSQHWYCFQRKGYTYLNIKIQRQAWRMRGSELPCCWVPRGLTPGVNKHT
jgi:hypothetical protein